MLHYDINNKILSLSSLLKKLPVLRRQGKTIAFTNGCFDLMHIGHVKYLEEAGRGNRILIVGLNSDVSISRIKGPSRPIVVQKSRAAVLPPWKVWISLLFLMKIPLIKQLPR